jgi:hypothetical protein
MSKADRIIVAKKELVKYEREVMSSGKFTRSDRRKLVADFSNVVEVEGVILLKVNDFPYYPKVSGVDNFGKNRISINKIQKRKNHAKPSFVLPKREVTSIDELPDRKKNTSSSAGD